MIQEMQIKAEYIYWWPVSKPFKTNYTINTSAVFLLPACLGQCICEPTGKVTLLEIAIPDSTNMIA